MHELHVWQLSETRHIASVHIRLDQGADYMCVVHDIRKILHKCDIHNATIQPEFEDVLPLGDREPMGSCLVACAPGVCDAEQICCREHCFFDLGPLLTQPLASSRGDDKSPR